MRRFRVVITGEAARNINAIYEWISRQSPDGALRWYSSIQDALAKLEAEADRFPIAPDCREIEVGIRHLILRMKSRRAYRVLFKIVESDVLVLFVRAPGQDEMKP